MTVLIDKLVVVVHPDDEILRFAGAGAAMVAQEESVQPIILCGQVNARSQRPSDEDLYIELVAANNLVGFL